MRITFVIPEANLSGGIRVVAIYAERLSLRGHRVVVVSVPAPVRGLMQKAKSLLKGKGWPSDSAKSLSHLDGRPIDHRVIDGARPVTDGDVPDADVVVATWWETAEWVAKLSRAKGAKAYFLQGYEVFEHLPQERVKATLRLPMHKIVVARWLADLARDKFADQHASLVPNGIDLEQFHAPVRSKRPKPTVGLLYSAAPLKGCSLALEAYARAQRRIPDLALVAFGQHAIDPQLPLPRATAYTMNPAQAKLRNLYAECDAWLFASRTEGFGLPILEAMACHTPVIGTPAGAAPELIGEGGGILVRPDDPDDMARAIETVARLSDADWQAMSAKAHATASSRPWSRATELFEAALKLAVERGQHGDLRAS